MWTVWWFCSVILRYWLPCDIYVFVIFSWVLQWTTYIVFLLCGFYGFSICWQEKFSGIEIFYNKNIDMHIWNVSVYGLNCKKTLLLLSRMLCVGFRHPSFTRNDAIFRKSFMWKPTIWNEFKCKFLSSNIMDGHKIAAKTY